MSAILDLTCKDKNFSLHFPEQQHEIHISAVLRNGLNLKMQQSIQWVCLCYIKDPQLACIS